MPYLRFALTLRLGPALLRGTPCADPAPADRSRCARSPADRLPAGGARRIRGLAHSIVMSQVGRDCSGVAPPPISDCPGTTLAPGRGVRARSASARSRIASAGWRIIARAGIASHRSSSRLRSVVSNAWQISLSSRKARNRGDCGAGARRSRVSRPECRPAGRPAIYRR